MYNIIELFIVVLTVACSIFRVEQHLFGVSVKRFILLSGVIFFPKLSINISGFSF